MPEPVMKLLPFEGYPGRFLSVNATEIRLQRALGWPNFHPEDFCHRCGQPNVSWYTDSFTWNMIMASEIRWNGIICVPCFIALTESILGECSWRLTRNDYGSEVLTLLRLHRSRVTTNAIAEG